MPFKANEKRAYLNMIIRNLTTIEEELSEDATLDEAMDAHEESKEQSEWLYDDVKALREADDLSESEQERLSLLEQEMNLEYNRAETLLHAVNRLTSCGIDDMTRPVSEIKADVKDERRRLTRYLSGTQ